MVEGCVGADGSIRLYDDGVIEGDGADGIHLSVAMRTSNGRKTSQFWWVDQSRQNFRHRRNPTTRARTRELVYTPQTFTRNSAI